jgi:hypothetical protein
MMQTRKSTGGQAPRRQLAVAALRPHFTVANHPTDTDPEVLQWKRLTQQLMRHKPVAGNMAGMLACREDIRSFLADLGGAVCHTLNSVDGGPTLEA